MAFDLLLMGTGVNYKTHLTIETQQAIKVCRKIFVLHEHMGLVELLKSYGKQVVDLSEVYHGFEKRQDVYNKISEILIDEAKHTGKVGFLVQGHPLFLVSATEYTLELAAKENLKVEVLPAVSSFDTILASLKIDYCYGLQIFDATTLISNNWHPNTAFPMLIFQLATTMNERIVKGALDSSILSPLKLHLLKNYPENHICKLVYTPKEVLDREIIKDIPLSLLDIEELFLESRPTLYVPQMGERLYG